MANLMITTVCNFQCAYCFGLDMIGPSHPRTNMPMEVFRELLDWIDRGAPPEMDVHLMGGEPTLSPFFGEMVEELAQRKRRTVVFSNAAASLDEAMLRRTVKQGTLWIVNCNDPSTYRGDQLSQLYRNLAVLGPAATITLNITGPQDRFDYVLEYIERYELVREIKLGVALPTMEHRNVFASWDDRPRTGAHIMTIYREAKARGIGLEFECGVPYCLFDEAQHRELDSITVSHCGSRLDITPDGRVINCLPLCKVAAVPFRHFADYGKAREWFARMLNPYRQTGSMAQCLTCEHRLRQHCFACLAFGIAEYDHLVLPPLPDGSPVN